MHTQTAVNSQTTYTNAHIHSHAPTNRKAHSHLCIYKIIIFAYACVFRYVVYTIMLHFFTLESFRNVVSLFCRHMLLACAYTIVCERGIVAIILHSFFILNLVANDFEWKFLLEGKTYIYIIAEPGIDLSVS